MEKIKINGRMKKRISAFTKILLVLMFSFVLSFSLVGCGSDDIEDDYVENEIDMSYDKDREALDTDQLGNTILAETDDAGQEYLDNTLFIGDSNTVRSMMYGHTTWDNVVAAVSMGVQHIPSLKMTYFKGMKEAVTVPEAVKIIQPQRIVITYGTNNTIGYDTEAFLEKYKAGLDAIKEKWPYADIIINAIPPIDRQRENLAVTMQTIDKFNKALAEFAKEEGYKFLNSTEVLKDEETGFAKKDYTIGDGVHLSKAGMDAMFTYFRTHAYITEDTRPKPLKAVPEREETPTGIITQDPLAVRGTRIRILFTSSDPSLGRVDGEVEQKIKRTITSSAVTAVPITENGGIFTGWSCGYSGLSSTTDASVRFTVPKVDDNVTEIVITANFTRAGLQMSTGSVTLETGGTASVSAWITGGFTGYTPITWWSNNNRIATVDGSGNIKAVGEGKTTVCASILGGRVSTSCTVTVKAAAAPSPSPSPSPSATPESTPEVKPDVTPEVTPVPTPDVVPEPTPELTCGAAGHTVEGTCPACGEVYIVPTCPDCGATDHTTHPVPTCPDCGATDHTTHPVPTCPDCGATDHTVHPVPTCPDCGATDHTVHPVPTCPDCGATDHTTHPVPQNNETTGTDTLSQ